MTLARLLALPLLALGLGAAPPAAAPGYDVVIRGGTVYDGSGGKPFVADVAVTGASIAALSAPSGGSRPHGSRRARQGGVARLHQHARPPRGEPDRRWARGVRPDAERDAGGWARI
ncbi:hypothetical protein [Sphingomonas sp. CROZ-RG-20F-R02-07]|uniref:hypothetical protein n=1 Tax=Sphingomonas sp. CROZ-RG-20F-R02-07 TaxID=2914832 RepID=UPI001F5689F5|nr:hypothetical protein [Sphingomonas sp. CROZ-RG-20F-R02-07]